MDLTLRVVVATSEDGSAVIEAEPRLVALAFDAAERALSKAYDPEADEAEVARALVRFLGGVAARARAANADELAARASAEREDGGSGPA